MRRALVSLVALVTILGTMMVSFPAEAGPRDWVFGTAFRIGHLGFHLVFRDFDHGRPSYYYRTNGHFRESRYRCNDRCFKEGDHDFHDVYCPRVLNHLENHSYNPYDVFNQYAPRYDTRSGYSNDRRSYDQRSYDRRYDYRDQSWRQRHHGRHRHSGSCRHRH